MDPNSTCYTIVNDDSLLDSGAAPSIPDLRNALQKGSDEVKMDTMRRVIVGTLNGQNYVRGNPVPIATGGIQRCSQQGYSSRPPDCPLDAYDPICLAFTKQANQEVAAFLLGVSHPWPCRSCGLWS